MERNDSIPGILEWSIASRIISNPRPAEFGPHTPHDGDQLIVDGARGWESRILETYLTFRGKIVGKLMKCDNGLRYVVFKSGLRTPTLNPMTEIHGVVMPSGTPSDGVCKAEARLYYSRRFEGLNRLKQVGVLVAAYRMERVLGATVTDWPKRYPSKSAEERSREYVRQVQEILSAAEGRYGFNWNEDAFFPKGEMPWADQTILDKYLELGEAEREVEAFNC